jgi:hypothetical protein
MSSNYYGRIDYSSPMKQENSSSTMDDLFISLFNLIKAIGGNISRKFKIML